MTRAHGWICRPALLGIVALALGCATTGAACAAAARGPSLATLTLRTLQGQPAALGELEGSALVLYLLTTGCDACLADQAKLRALDDRFAAQGLRVVLVAMDPVDDRVVQAFAASLDSPFVVLRADAALASGRSALGPVPRVPRVLILDVTRRVVLDAEGVLGYAELERGVAQALAASAGARRRSGR